MFLQKNRYITTTFEQEKSRTCPNSTERLEQVLTLEKWKHQCNAMQFIDQSMQVVVVFMLFKYVTPYNTM